MEVVELDSIKRELVLAQARLKLTVMAGTQQVPSSSRANNFLSVVSEGCGLQWFVLILLECRGLDYRELTTFN